MWQSWNYWKGTLWNFSSVGECDNSNSLVGSLDESQQDVGNRFAKANQPYVQWV
jgi:hypothetical protein